MTHVILHLDGSKESSALRKSLEKTGNNFRVVFTSDSVALETKFGIIRGYENIVRYLSIETS